MVICARTDARNVIGLGGVIERLCAYTSAGADMLFPEGLHSLDEFAEVATSIRAFCGKLLRPPPYLLANMTEFGQTPNISVVQFATLGYNAVIFPVSTLRLAMGAITRGLGELQHQGHLGTCVAQMQTRQELYEMLQYDPAVAWRPPK
eukprot:TRINITY_DN6898_c0_g1_i1.p2 TRINITY_DN6898_c0_g1~~TRINITY_DN6898_c0_g1_i1.p2  ORF type:complete len:148 (-),score=28.78 TRINITY_DN6898_c0_g1_i1:1082-1525(-)